jgi:DNA-binding NarL/FixJ family response regulator
MRVLVVDDHPLIRAALKAILLNLDAEVAVAEAGTAREALEQGRRDPAIDVVLLDLMLPDVSGIEAVVQVKEVFDSVPVIVVSAQDDPDLASAAIRAGAAGYVAKSTADAGETARALRQVLAHGVYMPGHMLAAMGDGAGAVQSVRPQFSPRQQEVLVGLLHGKSNKAIARVLNVSEGTVKAHLWAIYQVLGVSTRLQAFERCHKLGLIGSVRLDGRSPS